MLVIVSPWFAPGCWLALWQVLIEEARDAA